MLRHRSRLARSPAPTPKIFLAGSSVAGTAAVAPVLIRSFVSTSRLNAKRSAWPLRPYPRSRRGIYTPIRTRLENEIPKSKFLGHSHLDESPFHPLFQRALAMSRDLRGARAATKQHCPGGLHCHSHCLIWVRWWSATRSNVSKPSGAAEPPSETAIAGAFSSAGHIRALDEA
jgi:hypothetical protein